MQSTRSVPTTDRLHHKNRSTIRGAILSVSILLCMAVAYYAHFVMHTDIVYAHLFYVPIVLAGFWWARRAVWVALFMSGCLIICHGLSPIDTSMLPTLFRSAMLVTVGSVVGILRERDLRAGQTLRESGKRDRLLSDYAADVIWSTDMDLQLTHISPSITRLTSYTVQETLAMTIGQMLTPDSVEVALRAFEELMALEAVGEQDLSRSRTVRLEYVCKDQSTVWTESVMTIHRDAEGRPVGILGVARDISELIQAEKDRTRLESELRQAQKMEAVGQLAAGVAHDFNNSLTVIQGYTDLALIASGDDESLSANLNEIRRAAVRATNLTRQLLLFSHRHVMKIAPFDLNRLVQDLSKMLRRLIGEDISLTTDLEPDIWTIEGDAGTIQQVIMNLVVNARDAMPDGGKITIKTENVRVNKEFCQACDEAQPGPFVRLSIRDTGVGMQAAVMRRIFEPFFTAKKSGKGSGMGLAVVYGIVKQHEGWINVESAPGEGAIFRVYLPAVPTQRAEECEPAIASGVPRGKGERVLLVEDDTAVRDLTARALSDNGYLVYPAASAEEALDIFQKEDGDFDLVLIDVVLPDETGPRLAHQLLKSRPAMGVLFASGYSSEKLDWRLIQEFGYSHIQKPYSLVELLGAVRDVLG